MQKIVFKGLTDVTSAVINELKENIGFEVSNEGTEVFIEKRKNNGLTVRIADEKAVISYGIIPDFCRALCILADALKKGEKDYTYSENREVEKAGIMLDLSRNAVVKVETAKDLIKRIARMGLNTFMLYMENIYKMKDYPYFGYMRGAYTEDELREIDSYALKFGIEVVPCIQTLGHLSNALRWPYANGMKDTSDILLIDEPKTYEFIESMIKTLDSCLTSNRVHVGMDEAFFAGTGVYKAKHGEVNKMEMMGRHLSKVKEITDKYGKTPIMWCDMLMRYCSKKGQYWDVETEVTKENAKLVPNGYDLAYWDYYFETQEVYDAMFSCLKKMSSRASFYGGIWMWGGMSVNYDKTFRTTKPGMLSSRKHGIDEICATLWGDDGGEVSFYTTLLGMQLFAEYIYHSEVSSVQLKEMFKICTGYEAESFLLLDIDNIPESENYKNTASPTANAITVSKQLLYQDTLQGLLDKQYEHLKLREHYEGILKKYETAVIPEDLKELFEYNKQLVRVLMLKCDLGMRMTANYKAGNRELLKENLAEVKALIPEVETLHALFAKLWLRDNKAFGLDRVDLRMGGVAARLKRAAMRLESYLEGEVDMLEELAEERLKFTEEEFLHCPFYCYYSTASMQIEKQW